ncbi:hypothetical protein V6N13_001170 [Hibiscus sabdariffa]
MRVPAKKAQEALPFSRGRIRYHDVGSPTSTPSDFSNLGEISLGGFCAVSNLVGLDQMQQAFAAVSVVAIMGTGAESELLNAFGKVVLSEFNRSGC